MTVTSLRFILAASLAAFNPLPAKSTRADANERPDVEVTVVATRSPEPSLETAGTSTAVTQEESRARGAVSLGDTFRYEPGLSVPFDFAGDSGLVPYLGGGDQAVNIRGLEGNRVSMLVDGIRQPEDFVAQAFLGAGGPGRIYFDPAVLSQIEVFRSAASDLYGSDALGGAVAGQTVSPRSELGGSLEGLRISDEITFASVNQSFNNRFVAAWGNGTTAASTVYSFRSGEERQNNGDPEPNSEDFDSHAIVAKALQMVGDFEIEGTVDYFHRDNFIDADAAEGSFFNGAIVNEKVTQEEERTRLRFSLRLGFKPEGATDLFDEADLHAYWQDSEARTFNVQQGQVQFGPFPSPRDRRNDITYDTVIHGLDGQAEKLLETGSLFHEILHGFELSQSDVEADFQRTDFAPDGTPTDENRIGMAPSEVLRFGLLLRDRLSIGVDERWVLTPGMRFDYYEVAPDNTDAFLNRTVIPGTADSIAAVAYENTAFAPSLSVLYRFTEALNGYLTYSHGIRNPTAEELNGVFTHGTDFVVVPNPDLKEETSDSFEGGLQLATPEHTAQLAVFYNFYDDFLESNVLILDNLEPEPDVLTTVNLGEVEIYGIEASWDWRLPEELVSFGGLQTGLAFAWSEGERTDIDQPLNSIEPWKLVGYAGYEEPGGLWGVRLTATYQASKDESDIDQTTDAGPLDGVDDYFLLDLAAFWQISEHFRLNAGVNNLTDEAYYLWSTARRGQGHGGEAGTRNTQPGINGFVTLSASF